MPELRGEDILSSQRPFSRPAVTWVLVPSIVILLSAGAAMAQNTSANYAFLLASGLLCDSADSTTCPAVVKSADGASYEMSGAGAFTSQSKSVTAAGTFTHKSSDGVVLETGVWVASELVSFDSYGIAPGALNREGLALGRPQFGPMRMRMVLGLHASRRARRAAHPPVAGDGVREERDARSELRPRQSALRTPRGRNKAGIRKRRGRIR